MIKFGTFRHYFSSVQTCDKKQDVQLSGSDPFEKKIEVISDVVNIATALERLSSGWWTSMVSLCLPSISVLKPYGCPAFLFPSWDFHSSVFIAACLCQRCQMLILTSERVTKQGIETLIAVLWSEYSLFSPFSEMKPPDSFRTIQHLRQCTVVRKKRG